jgi:hypothetical protein
VEATALVTTPRDPSASAHEDINSPAIVIKDLTHHVPDSHRPTVPTSYASLAGAPPPPSDSALKRAPDALAPPAAQVLPDKPKPGIQPNSGMKNHSLFLIFYSFYIIFKFSTYLYNGLLIQAFQRLW